MSSDQGKTSFREWFFKVLQAAHYVDHLFDYCDELETILDDFCDGKTYNYFSQEQEHSFYSDFYKFIIVPFSNYTYLSQDQQEKFIKLTQIFLKYSYYGLIIENPHVFAITNIILSNYAPVYINNSGLYDKVCTTLLETDTFQNYNYKVSQMDPNDVEVVFCYVRTIYTITIFSGDLENIESATTTSINLISNLNSEKNRDISATNISNALHIILEGWKKLTELGQDINEFASQYFDSLMNLIQIQITSEFFDKIQAHLKLLVHIENEPVFKVLLKNWFLNSHFYEIITSMDIKPQFMQMYADIFKTLAEFEILLPEHIQRIFDQRHSQVSATFGQFYYMFEAIANALSEDLAVETIGIYFAEDAKNTKEWIQMIINIGKIFGRRGFDNAIDTLRSYCDALSGPEFDSLKATIDVIGITTEEFDARILEMTEMPEITNESLIQLDALLSQFSISNGEIARQLMEKLKPSFNALNPIAMNLTNTLIVSCGVKLMPEDIALMLQCAKKSDSIYKVIMGYINAGFIPIDVLIGAISICPDECINRRFYRFIKEVMWDRSRGLELIYQLPFIQEDLLWTLCMRKSPVQKHFQQLFCRIISRNDQESLTDEVVIRHFLTRWNALFTSKTTTKSMALDLLEFLAYFINRFELDLDLSNYGLQRHRMVRPSQKIIIHSEYNDDTYTYYADKSMSVTALTYHLASYFSLQPTTCRLKHEDKVLDLNTSLVELESFDEVDLTIVGGKTPEVRMRSSIPSLFISTSPLMDRLWQVSDQFNVSVVLDLVPTYPLVLSRIRNLNEENLLELFNVNKPRKFAYSIETLIDAYDATIHGQLVESGCIPFLINSMNETNKLSLNALIKFLLMVISGDKNLEFDDQTLSDNILRILVEQHPVNQNLSITCRNCIELIQYIRDPDSVVFNEEVIDNIFNYYLLSEYKDIRMEGNDFLLKLPIPQEYYSNFADQYPTELTSQFFTSWSDHIVERDQLALQLANIAIESHLEKPGHFDIYDSLMQHHLLSEDEEDFITEYCASYLDINRDFESRSRFDSALQIIERKISDSEVLNAIKRILKSEIHIKSWEVDGDKVKAKHLAVGLDNLGVTCFVNSTLQQLFRIKELRQNLFDYDGDDDFMLKLRKLFGKMMLSDSKSCSPRSALENWEADGSDPFETDIQQDASEFLTLLLDKLERHLGRDKLSMFNGTQVNRIESLDGSHSRESVDHFVMLPVDVVHCSDLNESISKISTPDFLRGANAIKFEDDGEKMDAKKYCQVSEPPRNLIIQLKRFEYSTETWTRYKIDTPLSFPVDLEMCGHNYKLSGVVIHRGCAEAGHYYSFCKQPNGEWYEFNDDMVSSVRESYVLNKGCAGAYLLFYDEVGHSFEAVCPEDIRESVENNTRHDNLVRIAMSQSFNQMMLRFAKSQSLMKNALALNYYFRFMSYVTVENSPDAISIARELLNRIASNPRVADASFLFRSLLCPLLACPQSSIRSATASLLCAMLGHAQSQKIIDMIYNLIHNWSLYAGYTAEMFTVLEHAAQYPDLDRRIESIGLYRSAMSFALSVIPNSKKVPRLSPIINFLSKATKAHDFAIQLAQSPWVDLYIDDESALAIADLFREYPDVVETFKDFIEENSNLRNYSIVQFYLNSD